MSIFAVTVSTEAQAAPELPWSASPSTSVVTEGKVFQNDGATLDGTLYLPREGRSLAALVLTHSASKPLRDAPLYQHLKEILPPLGIAVFAYDRRGSGASTGNLAGSDYALLADDAVAAVQMLKADQRIDLHTSESGV